MDFVLFSGKSLRETQYVVLFQSGGRYSTELLAHERLLGLDLRCIYEPIQTARPFHIQYI